MKCYLLNYNLDYYDMVDCNNILEYLDTQYNQILLNIDNAPWP